MIERVAGRSAFPAKSPELARRNLFGGGAGSLEKVADSTRETDRDTEEFLADVLFSGVVDAGDGMYRLTVRIHRGDVALRACHFSFPVTVEHAWMADYMDAGDCALTQHDLARFGVDVKAKRYAVQGAVAEVRLQLVQRAQGETETVTIAEEAHWQNSHSHSATAESYALVEGAMIIVSATPDGAVKVEGFAKTEIGFRLVTFFYDPQSGREWGERVTELYGSVSPIIQTEAGVPHNVFLGRGTVIATSKVVLDPGRAKSAGADWHKEESFDRTLNEVVEDSDGNPGVTHIEIIDRVYTKLSAA